MPRDIDSAVATAAAQAIVYPAFLIEAEFDSETLLLWNGIGDLDVDGVTYIGAGKVLQMALPQETGELEAQKATFQLAGVQGSDLSIALQEDYQGRPVRVKLGLFDQAGVLIGTVTRVFSGRMDVMTIADDPDNPVITMTAESDLVTLNRAELHNRTHEDQQIDHAGDRFFEFVPAMQNKEINWGKT